MLFIISVIVFLRGSCITMAGGGRGKVAESAFRYFGFESSSASASQGDFSMLLHLFLYCIYCTHWQYFKILIERLRERKSEKRNAFHLSIHALMPTTAKAGPGVSQEPRTQFGFLTWVAWTQSLEPPLLPPRVQISRKSCIRSEK